MCRTHAGEHADAKCTTAPWRGYFYHFKGNDTTYYSKLFTLSQEYLQVPYPSFSPNPLRVLVCLRWPFY